MGLPVDPFPGEQQFNLWKLLKKKKLKVSTNCPKHKQEIKKHLFKKI